MRTPLCLPALLALSLDDGTIDRATPWSGEVIAARICPDDLDWFSFDLSAGERLSAGIIQNANDQFYSSEPWVLKTAAIRLTDADGNTLVSSFAQGFHQTFSDGTSVEHGLTWRAQDDATVFLEVRPPTETEWFTYNLHAIVEDDPCDDDEREDDDDFASATAVELGEEVDGVICRDDVDVVAFDVDAAGTIEIQLAFDAEAADLDAELLDSEGHRIGFLGETLTDELGTFEVEAGTYGVRIRGWEMPCPYGRCENWDRPPGTGDYTVLVRER